jgi:DNA helicase-2/ATP-dependent DNA helicase PcrA
MPTFATTARRILAVTFTNKAAPEMRERLVGASGKDLWVSPFHSMCVKPLRRYGRVVGLEENFTVLAEPRYALKIE